MHWTWDPDKAAANRVKHGLSFETAVLERFQAKWYRFA
jgi:uncharacterized DUF497 family protein